jgi:uncharacterized membrane protein (UPF0127 family)
MKKKLKKRDRRIFYLGITIFFLIILYIYLLDENIENISIQYFHKSAKPIAEYKFTKEGELIFFSKATREEIKQIDIEITDNQREFLTGLMYRQSMPDSAGMLFILRQFRPPFFWMRNTYIPLDMIFVDRNMKIVKIQKNTKPLSEKRIPIHGNSEYVVEVNAGFCDKHNIMTGDYILFRPISITKRNNSNLQKTYQ